MRDVRPDRLSWLLLATHVPSDGTGGGMVRYAVELGRALAGLDGVELRMLVRPGTVDFVREEIGLPASGLVVSRWPGPPLGSMAERSGLGVAALRRGVDVVHGTKHLVPRLSGAARVLTVHDMLLVDRPRDFPLLKRWLLRRPYLASMQDADVLVAVSETSRRRAQAHLPGVADKTAVVPLAVARSLLEARPAPVPGLRADRTALVVSDFGARKNLPFLLRCWPEVASRQPGATLAIVGPLPSRGTAEAAELTAAERAASVVHLGQLPDAQLRWLYEHVAVTLCPSTAEGFGLPALEALTFGSPVLTSTDPALREATAGRATALPAGDTRAWCAAVVARLVAPRPREAGCYPTRSWSDVAGETVAAARLALRSLQEPGMTARRARRQWRDGGR